MYRSRKLLITALVLLVVCFIGAAATAAPIKVVHIMADHGQPFLDFLNERAEAFEAKYPGVDIEVIAQQADYTTKVQLMLASGNQVDVLDSTHSFMIFSGSDALADMMPYVKAENINLDREMLGFAKLVLMSDGKLLGIPSQLYGVAASYNRSYFEEMGVPPLRNLGDDWNWDWIFNNLGRLTRDVDGDNRPETYGMAFSNAFINLSPAIHQAGGSMFDSYLHPRRVQMKSEPVRVGLNFYVELYKRGWLTSYNNSNFYNKRQAAITNYSVGADTVLFAPSTDVFEAIVQPKGPVRRGGHTFFGPFHIPAESQQKEWAFRWVAFLALNEESQVRMMEITGRIPAHYPTLRRLEAYLGGADERKRNFLLQLRSACTHPDSYPHTLTPAENALKGIFQPAWNNVLNGTMALENFLETMQHQMQVELDRIYQK